MIAHEAPTWLDLARKYLLLAGLQRAHAAHGEVAGRHVFQALATEFPGALRELDALTLDELDARAEALQSVARGETLPESWMVWIRGYHALMRAALWIKFTQAQRNGEESQDASALILGVHTATGNIVDEVFVLAVLNPPGGRLNPVVFARLSADHGVAPSVIRARLFSPRRP